MKQKLEVDRETKGFPISDLMRMTSVSREMIKHYLRNGILPPPNKPRRNLSLYTSQHANLIKLVQRYQVETKNGLSEIANIFSSFAYDPHRIELYLLTGQNLGGDKERLSHRIEEQIANRLLDGIDPDEEEMVALEFDDHFLESLRDAGLIARAEKLSNSDAKSAALLLSAQEYGLSLDFFQRIQTPLLELTQIQMKALKAIPLPDMTFAEGLSHHYSADKIVNQWLIREKTKNLRTIYRDVMDSVDAGLSHIAESIYIPSEAFKQRHHVPDAVSEALENVDSLSPEELTKQAAAAIFLSEYDVALKYLNAGLLRGENRNVFLALMCFANSLNGKLSEAEAQFKELENVEIETVWSIEAKILYLLFQASKIGGIADASLYLAKAYELYTHVQSASPGCSIGRLETLLIRGRARSMFPHWIPYDDETLTLLKTLESELTTKPIDELGLPYKACHSAYFAYCNFYLARLLELDDNIQDAEVYYESVIRIDPASNFGIHAYQKLP